jgi:hypothetical protein
MHKGLAIIVVLLVLLIVYYVVVNMGDKKEVYVITSNDGSYRTSFEESKSVVKLFDSNAELATYDQVLEAQKAGAQWCSSGWMNDGRGAFPMQGTYPGCGISSVNIWTPDSKKANIIAYGVKPNEEDVRKMRVEKKLSYWILPFYQPVSGDTKPRKWSQYDT